VLQQVARVRGPTAGFEVGGRGRGRHALPAWADGDGDHVLLEPLLVADAGVAARGQHVNETLLDHHVKADVGIGGLELRHQRRQNQARRASRHVQPQRAGGAIAEAVDDVQRGLDALTPLARAASRKPPARATET